MVSKEHPSFFPNLNLVCIAKHLIFSLIKTQKMSPQFYVFINIGTFANILGYCDAFDVMASSLLNSLLAHVSTRFVSLEKIRLS